jgi:alpha-amylase/alpha-mannosidase (GH57 family)
MPQIYLCFLWHMHQPFYKDLISGEYKLPWTRLHALKDYYGMAQILEEFPRIRQTFNLVPSMVVQLQEYATGQARDPFLQAALKPAEDLTDAEQDFLLQQSFLAYAQRMIYRYPRYGELYEAWQARKGLENARRAFGSQEFQDLQVLSQLAWFDEQFLSNDPEVAELARKGRNFALDDQKLMGRKQQQILGMVIPAYQRLAAAGQIEISTTPYYHPILPLLCDSNIAAISHPDVTLPTRFRYPQDARRQLELARQFITREFASAPLGLWPSEGSVSDEVFALACDTGFRWTATDSGVLAKTLGRSVGPDAIYRPYRWVQQGREIQVLFRDHLLSDLIGFVYSRMGAQEAAIDFVNRIRDNCRPLLAGGRNVLVPIILDGENAWEYYEQNGRPFLRELYRRISEDEQMRATTIGDALRRIEPETVDHIFPGSWINANFDVWIGAEEDNQAWEQLLRARESYDRVENLPEDRRRLAYEELLIAEGSDWCWWYGPEHESANRAEFDQLYRGHLANMYASLDQVPPEELSRPILKVLAREFHLDPTGPVRPVIDGQVSSYFEWIGAGVYRVDLRSGAMHGKRFLVREVYYGTDGTDLFLRVDFQAASEELAWGLDVRLSADGGRGRTSSVAIALGAGEARVTDVNLLAAAPAALECSFQNVLEIRVSLAALGVEPGAPVRFQFSLWRNGLPLDAVPQQGWLEVPTAASEEWAG